MDKRLSRLISDYYSAVAAAMIAMFLAGIKFSRQREIWMRSGFELIVRNWRNFKERFYREAIYSVQPQGGQELSSR